MSFKKLTTAAVAGASLIAVVPAAALARPARHVSPIGCHLTVFAEPHIVVSGEAPELLGAVVCPGDNTAAASSQKVVVYEHNVGTPGFKVVGETTTNNLGEYRLPVGTISTDTTFYAGSGGALSARRLVRVAPVVTVAAQGVSEGADLRTGPKNKVLFSGSVGPTSDNNAEVWLEREAATSSEEWKIIQGAKVKEGRFSFTHRFIVPGDANLRVIVRPHGLYSVRGISNTLSYEISQAENPRLTINTSADPASYGQPVTLSGTLAGAPAGEQVTLLSHPYGKPGFSPLATTSTAAGGTYTFTVAAATGNTAYEVTGGGVKSTILFQGVKYTLAATGPSGSVPADQAVTFGYTISPAPAAGQLVPVYLERANAVGGGYHVVATVFASAATGSIVYYPHGSGTQTYRVHVPGNPANQSTSSAPFTLTVTAPAAGTLRPAPQATLPH